MGEGAYSKAVRHLTSRGVHATRDPEVLSKLRALHPVEPVPPLLPPITEGRISFGTDAKEVQDRLQALASLIHSFPRLSGAGPSGLLPDHVKECLLHGDTVSAGDLLVALDAFVQCCVKGDLHPVAAAFVGSARLTALRKAARGGPRTRIRRRMYRSWTSCTFRPLLQSRGRVFAP